MDMAFKCLVKSVDEDDDDKDGPQDGDAPEVMLSEREIEGTPRHKKVSSIKDLILQKRRKKK